MTILAVEHVQLAMPADGEDLARKFYAGLLGMNERAKPAALAVRGGCWFETGAVKLHLGVETDFQPARKAHPALLVNGLYALSARLVAAGCDVRPDDPVDGLARIFVDDPFGNRIELMEAQIPGSSAPDRPCPLLTPQL